MFEACFFSHFFSGFFSESERESERRKVVEAMWSSVDPRNGQVVQYDSTTARILEDAFQRNDSEVRLSIEGRSFVVRFREMKQFNATGGCREVRRAGEREPLRFQFDEGCLDLCLKVVDELDVHIKKCKESLSNRKYRWRFFTDAQLMPLLQCYEWILGLLATPEMLRRYHGSTHDAELCGAPFGQQVPTYFANVADGSIYRRKVLSVLGLRNLVLHGGEIFNDLLVKLFSGNARDYAENTGLSKMKYYTGNTVDLDTVVLNPNRQLGELNRMSEAKFLSAEEFERDPLCRKMVVQQAEQLILEFVDTMKISEQERGRRCLALPDASTPIYVSTSNTDRGTRAVWHYKNVGVSTFHVNVPNLADVIGALLGAPSHLVKGFALAARAAKRDEALDEFFEDCISDSCFNGKWKSIEAFVSKWEQHDDVMSILSRLQQENQQLFLKNSEESDRANEMSEMMRLVREKQLTGFDRDQQKIRPITDNDVKKWIEFTNA